MTLQHRTLFQTKAVIATLGGALWLGVGLARLPSGDPKARVLVGFGLLCLALGGGLFLWVRRQ